MHESDLQSDATSDEANEPVVDEATETGADETTETDAGDAELDQMADDLDAVEAALKALDADDLDQAESLAASLGEPTASADETGADEPAPAPTASEA